MDISRFDSICRMVSSAVSRRALVKPAGAGALGLFGLAALLGDGDALAKKNNKKRRRRRRRRRRCKPHAPLEACTRNKDCCPRKTEHVCGTSHLIGPNTCCGRAGAACSVDGTCCTAFLCDEVAGRCVEPPPPL